MKKLFRLLQPYIYFISVLLSQESNVLKLAGQYLGERPPNDNLQLFAPGIISTNMNEDGGPIFTSDGKEMFWRIGMAPFSVILHMKEENGFWSKPRVAQFSGQYSDGGLCISPDGNKIFFASKRPINGNDGSPKFNTWVTEKINGNWQDPVLLGNSIDNPTDYYTRTTVTSDGTLIKQSKVDSGKGGWDLFESKYINGRYSDPTNLAGEVNTQFNEYGPAISPDGSYIIFQSDNRHDTIGSIDLYVTFKQEDGRWSRGINIGEKVNSEHMEHWPSITSDGMYLFFSSNRPVEKTYTYSKKRKTIEEIKALHDFYHLPRNGGDYYWISTKFIKDLKPK